MIELTDRQRNEALVRHLANAVFEMLSRGKWHTVTSGESSPYKVLGGARCDTHASNEPIPIYGWIAGLSPSAPRFGFPVHALLLDSFVYDEFMVQFAIGTRERWDELLEIGGGVQKLYYLRANSYRRNRTVPELLCALATGLVIRMQEMKLIVPVRTLTFSEMLNASQKEQVVLAALRSA